MKDSITYTKNGDAQSFTGEGGVNVFVMATVATGLRLYAKTGMKPNRAWTPTAMMRKAEELTGEKFGKRDYLKAADALTAKVQSEKKRIAAEQAGVDNNPGS